MKTRNWKLWTLVIFLSVCFTFYAGNCYPQAWGSQTDQPISFPGGDWLPMPIPDGWPRPDPWPDQILGLWPDGLPMPGQWPIYELPLFDFFWQPAGETTFKLFQERMPQLTYERFYHQTDYFDLDFDYDFSALVSPVKEIWNPFQRPGIFAISGAAKQKLYEFSKDFPVPMIKPKIWMTYGTGMSAVGYGGMDGLGAGFSPPFGLDNAFSGAFGMNTGFSLPFDSTL